MSEYQLELKQIVDYPRCRIYRQFIGLLMKDKSIRVGGTSGLYHFTVLSCFANFRTSYKRIDGISYTIYPGEWLCRVSELTEWFRTRFQHQALAILRELQDRHLITYTLLGRGRLVKFKIKGWCKYNRVLEYNAPCQKDTGFFFLPISVANELVSAGRCSEMDAIGSISRKRSIFLSAASISIPLCPQIISSGMRSWVSLRPKQLNNTTEALL